MSTNFRFSLLFFIFPEVIFESDVCSFHRLSRHFAEGGSHRGAQGTVGPIHANLSLRWWPPVKCWNLFMLSWNRNFNFWYFASSLKLNFKYSEYVIHSGLSGIFNSLSAWVAMRCPNWLRYTQQSEQEVAWHMVVASGGMWGCEWSRKRAGGLLLPWCHRGDGRLVVRKG